MTETETTPPEEAFDLDEITLKVFRAGHRSAAVRITHDATGLEAEASATAPRGGDPRQGVSVRRLRERAMRRLAEKVYGDGGEEEV